MNSLPLNNLSEHLARFAASKKSIASNQAAPNTKQFTFKKSLSLGKQNSSKVAEAQSSVNSFGSKKPTFNFNQVTSKNGNHSSSNKYQAAKQGTITNFFSQSNISKKAQSAFEENLNSSILNEDIFTIDDLDDFQIPSSRISNEKKSNKSVSPESKIKTEKEKPASNNTSREKIVKKENCNNGPALSAFSEPDRSKEPCKSEPFNSIPDIIDLEASLSSQFFDDDDDEILTYSSKRKSVQKIVSDDESDFNDDKFDVNSVDLEAFDIKKEEDPIFSPRKQLLQNEISEQNFCFDDIDLKDIDSSTKPAILDSLQEMNIKVMNQICDLIATKTHFLSQNVELNNLVNIRKKVLNQFQAAQNAPTVSENTFFDYLRQKSEPQPTFEKLKPGKLFQTKTENENSHKPSERLQTSPTECVTVSSSESNSHFPKFEPTSPSSPSLISTKSSSFKPASSIATSSGFASRMSFNNDKVSTNSKLINKESFHTKGNNNVTSASIEIQDVETQNFIDQTIYDIHDDDTAPVLTNNFETDEERIIAGKFCGNQRDDGASSEFKGFNFPFSKDLMNTFHNVFGL
ncbi:hypothetical protein JTE90_018309 [Oedothorax gibbosus]|uniref:Uncharacterized protein n=1 Tax=Oedothorax gibbosus TaxID=931172 RepID=A0AAV6UF88_9ARAC|nr:hypothetical protein JTE90_018309 [Oedothorax gibbosus]